MKFKVNYHPEVYFDIQQAVDWYNEQQPDLGNSFFSGVKKQLNSLKKSALLFAIRYDSVRCMPVKRFPYLIHYRVDKVKKEVKVEAVFNTYRDSKLWSDRSGKI